MGEVCQPFPVGPRAAGYQAEIRDVLVEVTSSITTAAQLPLAATTARALTSMFDTTVGQYLERRGRETWAGDLRRFVLKRAARIGQEARQLALSAGDVEISPTHLQQATDSIFESTRAAEQRTAATVAA